ncbi:MAG: YfhO family protein [Anaerolineae bacterium]
MCAVTSLRGHRLWRDAAAILLLAGLTLGFYWRLLARDAYTPAGGGDLASFLYPYYAYAAQSLNQGRMPLWNPFVFSGMPFLGDIQSGLFYPLNLMQFLGHPRLVYLDMEALAILHILIAGVSTYICLRWLPQLSVGSGAALVGATAFMFSDLFVLHFGNLNMIAVAAWLPLVFVLFARALDRNSLRMAAWAGLVLGLSTLAGHIQPTLYNCLFLFAYAVWYATALHQRSHSARQALYPLLLLVFTCIVAIAVSLPATLPAYMISKETARASFSYWEAGRYSLSPLRLLGLALPDLFGRDPALYWGLGDRVESGYIGILPLLLAVFAAAKAWRQPWVRFFTVAAIGFLLLALGEMTPIHGWVYALMPGLDMLRAPARAIYLLDFALAASAAVACQTLSQCILPEDSERYLRRYVSAVSRYGFGALGLLLAISVLAVLMLQDRDAVIFRRAWIAANSVSRGIIVLAASLLLLRLAGKQLRSQGHTRAWLGAVLLLSYLDLASVGAYLDLGKQDPTSGFQHDAAIVFLKSDPNPYRVDVAASAATAWQPNLGCLYGIRHVGGVANPMELERYQRFLELAGDRSARLYDLLGAKYLVVSKGERPGAGKFVPVFAGDATVDLYLNTQSLPLALLLHEVRVARDADQAMTMLADPSFDPSRMLVIEGPAPQPTPAIGVESLSFVADEPEQVRLSAYLTQPGYILLSTPFAPGWRARLDGSEVPIWKADLAFMAVFLTAGQHTLELAYYPPFLHESLAISAVTLLAVVLITIIPIHRPSQ